MCAKRKSSSSHRLVDFATSFYTDLEMDGMLYAVIVRSPVARGFIKSITHPCLPDGYFLFTARDIPGAKSVHVLKTEIPVFATDTISYLGEPVGILVGPDKWRLEQLLSDVAIRVIPVDVDGLLPAPDAAVIVVDEEQENTDGGDETSGYDSTDSDPADSGTVSSGEDPAVDSSRIVNPELYLDFSGTDDSMSVFESEDILAHRIITGGGDAELIFAESDLQVEGNYSSVLNCAIHNEPTGGVAVYKQHMLSVYAPVQWFSQVRKTVAEVLAIDTDHVEIKKTLSAGNSTSNNWYSVIVLAQVSLAAVLCGKPVKLVFSREEQNSYTERGVPIAVNHRTAVDSTGKITSLIVSVVADTGIYNPFVQDIIDRLVISAAGLYCPSVYKIEAFAIRSQNPPVSVHLQQIESQAFFAVENHMQQIALQTGMLPDEVRLKNYDKEKTGPFNFHLDSVPSVIRTVTEMSSFLRKYAAYRLDRSRTGGVASLSFSVPIRGAGLSAAFEGCGYMGTEQYASNLSIKVTMEMDGSVVIHSYPPSAAVRNIWVRLVSSILDVAPENVFVDSNFDAASEPKYPAGFFGNIGVMTQLLRKCCTAIQRQRFRHPLPISISRGITRQQKKLWDSETFQGEPFYSTATGAAVVEVELEPCTFRIQIRGVWLAIDGGEILAKPQAVASLKSAVREVMGSLVDGDFLEAAHISVQFIHSTQEPKQIGGLVHTLIPAAFCTAVAQAFGCRIGTVPIPQDLIAQPVLQAGIFDGKYDDAGDKK